MTENVKILKITQWQKGRNNEVLVVDVIGVYTDTIELNKALQKYNITVDDLHDLGENWSTIPDNSYGFVLKNTFVGFTALYVENLTLNETLDKSLGVLDLDETEVINLDKLLDETEEVE